MLEPTCTDPIRGKSALLSIRCVPGNSPYLDQYPASDPITEAAGQ